MLSTLRTKRSQCSHFLTAKGRRISPHPFQLSHQSNRSLKEGQTQDTVLEDPRLPTQARENRESLSMNRKG